MEELTLMQKFSDPQLFEQLDNVEKMNGALITTLMGMGITFIILILLWGIIALMAKVINATEKKPQLAAAMAGTGAGITTANTQAENTVSFAAAGTSAMGSTSTSIDPQENAELVAVIMAAIAASEGSEFVNNLVVRRINRTAGNPPAWGRQGGLDCIESRKF